MQIKAELGWFLGQEKPQLVTFYNRNNIDNNSRRIYLLYIWFFRTGVFEYACPGHIRSLCFLELSVAIFCPLSEFAFEAFTHVWSSHPGMQTWTPHTGAEPNLCKATEGLKQKNEEREREREKQNGKERDDQRTIFPCYSLVCVCVYAILWKCWRKRGPFILAAFMNWILSALNRVWEPWPQPQCFKSQS